MSKVIKSPVKAFPGTVTLYDPLSFPQVIAIEDAFAESEKYRFYKWVCDKCDYEIDNDPKLDNCEKCKGEIKREMDAAKTAPNVSKIQNALLPAMVACIEKWDLEGVDNPPVPFPGTPKASATELLSWLITEVSGLFKETEDIPEE